MDYLKTTSNTQSPMREKPPMPKRTSVAHSSKNGYARDSRMKIVNSRQSVKELRGLYLSFLEADENGTGENEVLPKDEDSETDDESTEDSESEYEGTYDSSPEEKKERINENTDSKDDVDGFFLGETPEETSNRDEKQGLVAQLQSLHRQLNEVKSSPDFQHLPSTNPSVTTTSKKSGARSLGRHFTSPLAEETPKAIDKSQSSAPTVVGENSKIIACSIHSPVGMYRSGTGEGWVYKDSFSPFKAAIEYLSSNNETVFVNWTGAQIDIPSQEGVKTKLWHEYKCVPVFLPEETAKPFYNGFCHNLLWPIFHNMEDHVDYMALSALHDAQNAYVAANHRFLDVVANLYNDGDIVMIYGYQLMLLPALLRKRFPDMKCGFFFNTPFPTSEYWKIIPMREELLQGVLGSDLVAFHHYNYARHFTQTVASLLGLDASPRHIEYDRRTVMLACQPLSVDPRTLRITDKHKPLIEKLRENFEGMKVLVGMDRLDFVNGLPHKILAMETFLEAFPEWRGKVVLCQVVVDTNKIEGSYSAHKIKVSRQVNELIGKVNGKYGDVNYFPIKILRNSLSRDELMALYNMADVALVTPLRQGLNLCAFEYIACQSKDDPGVLIYSEFAGCDNLLKGALLINPYHTDQIARTLERALVMSPKRKQLRYESLLQCATNFNSRTWTKRVFPAIVQASARSKETQIIPNLDINYLSNVTFRSNKRLILLDFRGTLLTFEPIPQLNKPSPELISTLESLTKDVRNDVFVLGGVSSEILEDSLGHIPNLGFVAEYGYFVRYPGKDQPWQTVRSNINLWWKKDVAYVLEYFSDNTPGSFLEVGESCVTWHFRDTDKDFGLAPARLLQMQLEQMLQYQPAQAVLVFEKKYIVVHSTGIHKGTAIRHIMKNCENKESPYEIVIALGDDKTDEAMFKQLTSLKTNNVWSCSVNMRISNAQYYIDNVGMVLDLLRNIADTPDLQSHKE
eukprot:CAMPEP_0204825472 /NCGR_PEP_ID=MMETSP1346-20131115/3350_1 /ASSEMBLY_ACC=CAM_ASM_000771 /TAXON_ID=215587 /ORGANISM="Aplanochytrium stocchinoi, Strain GSBS06" /LENGTH=965 /DNA_ID=CAMNT_0051953119 /DNA_START=173 /DNA_END=3070 /DNA_ORIENTATION=-